MLSDPYNGDILYDRSIQSTQMACFDVLLTVHYSNDQFWFQLMHHNFTLLTKSLYMSPSQTYQPYSRHKR